LLAIKTKGMYQIKTTTKQNHDMSIARQSRPVDKNAPIPGGNVHGTKR
jgi:hypothetical protein